MAGPQPEAVITADWAIAAPARNRAAPAERSPKGDSVSDIQTSQYISGDNPDGRSVCLTSVVMEMIEKEELKQVLDVMMS